MDGATQINQLEPTPLDVALKLAAAGVSVIPIRPDGTKAPDCSNSNGVWKQFQSTIATEAEIRAMFRPGVGIGIIAGAVSGNLEILDIEGRAPFAEIVQLIEEHAPGLIARLPRVSTPSGGAHVFYRCATIEGNQKLAMQAGDPPLVAIETRGEGGYVVTIFSPIACHKTGRQYHLVRGRLSEIPTITVEERDILLGCCRSFNTFVRDEQVHEAHQEPVVADHTGRLRPGDDYNIRGDVLGLLRQHGWTIAYRRGDTAYLKRPGKKDGGISASFGHVAKGFFYVFSTNAFPFDFERAYGPFAVYTILEHGGDAVAAARALGKDGYGSPPIAAVQRRPFHEDIQQAPEPEKPVVAPMNDFQTLQAIAQLYHKPTEDSVALLFEKHHAQKLRHCKTWGTWLTWDGSRWHPENTNLAFDYCRELARIINPEEAKSPAKASFARGVEAFAAASRTFATTSSQWDNNTDLLSTPGGTIDLPNGIVRPASQLDYITKVCRVAPSDKPRPIFDAFMRSITLNDEALISYHQRALGSILSGAMTDHWILFWIGEGRNGKNTLGDLICWILGDYAKVIPTETLMSNSKGSSHPTDLASLRGVRLAVSSEVPEGSYWNEARIKGITGDEMISARFMHQDFFEFRRTHKHLIYGNHRPMLRVVDEAIKARFHVCPFKAKFPADLCDPLMPTKLRTEAPQILQWLIDGHQLWLEDGTLKKCSAVQEETDKYFEAQATPDMWLTERCDTATQSDAGSAELYKDFSAWKEARGEKPLGQTRWGEWMSGRFSKTKTGGRIVYQNIRLLPPDESVEAPRKRYERGSD